jgi:phosphoribosylanthranilate isomerase
MKLQQRTRVKICCISSIEEAEMAIEYGADAIGLVGEMPSGPGMISEKLIAEIAKRIPPPIASFLLTSERSAKGIIEQCKKVQTNTIQIVDALKEGSYVEIKQALPHVKLIQVIHVIDESSIEEAIIASKSVDALLLDSGNPKAKIKTLGGTGNTHDWELSKLIRSAIDIPLFLAGGLNASNVKEAIETVQPFGVDLCSGVRTNDNLDEEKLALFMEIVKR